MACGGIFGTRCALGFGYDGLSWDSDAWYFLSPSSSVRRRAYAAPRRATAPMPRRSPTRRAQPRGPSAPTRRSTPAQGGSARPDRQRKLDLAKLLVPAGKLVGGQPDLERDRELSGAGAAREVGEGRGEEATCAIRVAHPVASSACGGAEERGARRGRRQRDRGGRRGACRSGGAFHWRGRRRLRVGRPAGDGHRGRAQASDCHAQSGDPGRGAQAQVRGGLQIPAIASFGVGAAGIAVGTVFGLFAFDETNRARQFCDGNLCPARPEVIEARNVAIANGNVSTVGFVVGGVGVAAGVILLITSSGGSDKPEDKEKKDAFRVVPYVGPGEVGVVGTF